METNYNSSNSQKQDISYVGPIINILRKEKNKLKIVLLINFFFLASLIFSTLYYMFAYFYNQDKDGWSYLIFILPSIFILFFLYRVIVIFLEQNTLKKIIIKYKENMKNNNNFIPSFIINLYHNFNKKEIQQNWITFFIFFYNLFFIGLVSFLMYLGVKIENILPNPTLLIYILIIVLFLRVIWHIVFAIDRKKSIFQMETGFSYDVIKKIDIENIKQKTNKKYRFIFFITLGIIFIIPVIFWFIVKKFIKK